VLYSNRSACHASLRSYGNALADAQKCVELKPEWPKGYSRLGAALHGLGKYEEAVEALEDGLRRDPQSAQLQSALSEAVSARNRAAAGGGDGGGMGGGMGDGGDGGGGLGSLFGSDGLARLALDPRTRDLADDPGFRASLARVRADPSSLGALMGDEKMQRALEVLLGVRIAQGGGGPGGAGGAGNDFFGGGGGPGGGPGSPGDEPFGGGPGGGGQDEQASSAAKRGEDEAKAKAAAAEAEKAAAEEAAAAAAARAEAEKAAELTDEEKAATADRARRLAEAAAAKRLGAEAYAARDFAAAIAHFTAAVEAAGDLDVSFLLNRAAARYERASAAADDLALCVADCDAAVSRGRELRADFALVSRALTRKGNALTKMGDLEAAVGAYGKALTEHRSAETLKRLHDAEKALRQRRELAYVDLSLSEAERAAGNADFKAGRYPEAVARYAEALRRGPASANPEAHKLHSNLSAAYFKLGALADAQKNAERCIALAPAFAKGYSRKGAVEFLKRDYDAAMATYRSGLDALARAAEEEAAKAAAASGDGEAAAAAAAALAPRPIEGAEELREGLMKCATALNRLAHGQGSKEELEERRMKAMADPAIRNLLNEPAVVAALDAMQHDPQAAGRYLADPLMREKITRLVGAGIITMG